MLIALGFHYGKDEDVWGDFAQDWTKGVAGSFAGSVVDGLDWNKNITININTSDVASSFTSELVDTAFTGEFDFTAANVGSFFSGLQGENKAFGGTGFFSDFGNSFVQSQMYNSQNQYDMSLGLGVSINKEGIHTKTHTTGGFDVSGITSSLTKTAGQSLWTKAKAVGSTLWNGAKSIADLTLTSALGAVKSMSNWLVTPLNAEEDSSNSIPMTNDEIHPAISEEERKKIKVKEGDTLSEIAQDIAKKLGDDVSIADVEKWLKENNNIKNIHVIRAGEELQLPMSKTELRTTQNVNISEKFKDSTQNDAPVVYRMSPEEVENPLIVETRGMPNIDRDKLAKLLSPQTPDNAQADQTFTKNIIVDFGASLNYKSIPMGKTMVDAPSDKTGAGVDEISENFIEKMDFYSKVSPLFAQWLKEKHISSDNMFDLAKGKIKISMPNEISEVWNSEILNKSYQYYTQIQGDLSRGIYKYGNYTKISDYNNLLEEIKRGW